MTLYVDGLNFVRTAPKTAQSEASPVKARSVRTGYAVAERLPAAMPPAGTMVARRNSPSPGSRQRLAVCPLRGAAGCRNQAGDGVASGRRAITERGRSKVTTRA